MHLHALPEHTKKLRHGGARSRQVSEKSGTWMHRGDGGASDDNALGSGVEDMGEAGSGSEQDGLDGEGMEGEGEEEEEGGIGASDSNDAAADRVGQGAAAAASGVGGDVGGAVRGGLVASVSAAVGRVVDVRALQRMWQRHRFTAVSLLVWTVLLLLLHHFVVQQPHTALHPHAHVPVSAGHHTSPLHFAR